MLIVTATTGFNGIIRRRVHITGIVQGVGFRPFVHGWAIAHGISGVVRNRGGGVEIEAQGTPEAIAAFLGDLCRTPPPAAQIGQTVVEAASPRAETEFRIAKSEDDPSGRIDAAPDAATCPQCLDEVDDPTSRWFRYPFTSCSACGPRFTILSAAPYDREQTTMSRFTPCAECRADYMNPSSRRFHAQTVACPNCGPRLSLQDAAGARIDAADPIAEAGDRVRQGRIGALKGIGGFHLFCDATNSAAVEELRRRKRRDGKPLAIMVGSPAEAAKRCEIGSEEEHWLRSPARPIVLLRHRSGNDLAPAVSGSLCHTGVMLPYTALHHLLLQAVGGRPLVMTSGNAADEPTAFRDHAARKRLGSIADFFLTHDREIISRCDDSVVRFAGSRAVFIRRSRGYVPAPLRTPFRSAEPMLAAGAQLKATFALGKTDRAIVSHHLGDLDDYETLLDYQSSIAHYERLFRIEPKILVHDLHPDYASTRYAAERASRESLMSIAVQHHHAHLASCLADNGVFGPAIGVCFDGTGYGPDGAIWGGEFLMGDCREVERAAHLRYLPMPGGAKAIREPWRMAAAYLIDAGLGIEEWLPAVPRPQLRAVRQMIEKRVNAPVTSSAGRFFDAMAALLGLRFTVAYEGQAAVELEALARRTSAEDVYDFGISAGQPALIDLRPLVCGVVDDLRRGTEKTDIAGRIHTTLASLVEMVCRHLADCSGLMTVALSGGVFMNAILLEETRHRLARAGFRLLLHHRVPPNDGGISLGQLAVAAAQPR